MPGRKQDIKTIVDAMHAIRRKFIACNGVKKTASSITPSQWAVLGVILENKKVGVTDVAQQLGISSSAATQLVEGLVEKGYIVRRADKTDRRAFTLEIPSKHLRKIELLKSQTLERFTHLFGALTDKELKTYALLNQKLTRDI